MATIVLYFSLLGHNERIAKEISKNEKCKLVEFAPGSILRAFQFFIGKKKLAKKAKEINANLKNYDEIIVCGPIWGAKPAPAVKILLENLDMSGKNVKCFLTYTQDYGNSKEIVENLVRKNSGALKEIKFNKISKEIN